MGVPAGVGWVQSRNFRRPLLFRETRLSPGGVWVVGALGEMSDRRLAELLCGEGTLLCRETIERSLL